MDSYQTESMSWDDFLATWTSKNQTDDNAAILPIQLTNSTGTCLENLNDDCLLEIFSCNSLTLSDLCSLAGTCTRFKQIIERIFPKDYAIVCAVHRFRYEFRSKNGKTLHITPETVERILKHFGQHLSELFITSRYKHFLNLVGKYCGDATVKNLQIAGIKNLDDVIKPLDSILQRVQKLTMKGSNFTRTLPFSVLNSSSLIELNVNTTSCCLEILKCTFPNLWRFTWRFPAYCLGERVKNCEILHNFIRKNNHLTSIRISVCCKEILNVIDTHCKQLEELILIDMKEYRPSTSGCLTKLKILELDYLRRSSSPLEYIPLLKVVKSLEIIKMSCYPSYEIPDQTVDVLSQLENLRELHLSFGYVDRIPWTKLAQLKKVILDFCRYDPRHIINMIQKLINLEELELKRSGSFSTLFIEKYFLEICKIVERREHVLTLKCNLSLKMKEYCDDNRQVKLINVCESSDD